MQRRLITSVLLAFPVGLYGAGDSAVPAANPPEHIVAALAFEDHVINPGVVQQLTEQQP